MPEDRTSGFLVRKMTEKLTKNILIIDDDRLVTKSLAKLLEKEGYNISCVEGGIQACDLIDHAEFDLIISDVRMPGVNGIETVTNIKEILGKKNKAEIPVIFITGYSDEENYKDAEKLNPADFIYKPFDKEKFLQSIKNIFRGQ